MSKQLIICVNKRANPDQPSCGARGSMEIADCLEKEISTNNMPIRLIRQKCLGLCTEGPNIKLSPHGEFLKGVSQDSLPVLVLKIKAFCVEEPL